MTDLKPAAGYSHIKFPEGYGVVDCIVKKRKDSRAREFEEHRIGLILTRRNGGLTRFAGSDLGWKDTIYDVSTENAIKPTGKKKAIEIALELVGIQIDLDRKQKAKKKYNRRLICVRADLPKCESGDGVIRRVQCQLDRDTANVFDRIKLALLQTEAVLESGRRVESDSSVMNYILESFAVIEPPEEKPTKTTKKRAKSTKKKGLKPAVSVDPFA